MTKILLIEDDSSVQFTLGKLLTFFRCEVVAASDGKEGLERYNAAEKINFIICDIDMPTLNGFGFLQELLSTHHKIPPFIFISAYVTPEKIKKAVLLGANCVLKKPIDQEILRATLIALSKVAF